MMKCKCSQMSLRKLGASPKVESTDIVASKEEASESKYKDLSPCSPIACMSNRRPISADVDAGTSNIFATNADFPSREFAGAVSKGGKG